MPARLPSFWLKAALAVVVVALADWALFEVKGLGVNLAVVLTAATAALAITRPAVWRDELGRVALAAAGVLAVLPVERPSVVGFLLWVLAIAVATLAPRAARGDDGWRWGQRLVVAGVKALFMWVGDLQRLLQARARRRTLKVTAVILATALPVVGGLVFLELFAAANPVIARWQASFSLPQLYVGRIVFWVVIAFPMATILRPRGLRRPLKTPGIEGDLNLPGMSGASVAAALAVFNAVFAVQNGLDIAYLWSGAGLPDGVSFADYAHQGAYPLIATALLAGLFVLVFLRPGSATAARPVVRWLVIAWVAQNVFLVASTALRMADYIDAYSLTRMRIAALLWMALVALGLMLILWRAVRGASSSWLINANLLAAGVVLAVCSAIDLGSVAAAWNVRHLPLQRPSEFDLCYFDTLGGAGLISLAQLEQGQAAGDFRERIAWKRRTLAADMARQQTEWRTWRWRDARRLSRVNTITAGHDTPDPWTGARLCDGRRRLPNPPPPPLTPAANPRT